MKRPSALALNSVWMLLARVGSQGLAVVFTLLVARQLGSQAFGEYAFMAAVVALGNALTTFGTDMLLIRQIAAQGEVTGLGDALLLQLALSGGFIAAVLLAAPLFPNQSPEAVLGLRIYSLSLVPLAFFSVFTTALRGKQRMGAYMALSLALAALQVGAAWLAVRLGGGVVELAALLALVQVAAAVLAGILCARQLADFRQAWHFSGRKVIALGRACVPIALLVASGLLYQKLSVMLLSVLGGAVVTGWFAAALRTVEAAKTAHLATFTALYPAMAQQAQHQPDRGPIRPWQESFRTSWWLLLAGAGAASLALFLLAEPLTRLLYGAAYAPAVPALRILAWMLVPFTVNNFMSLAYLAARREAAILRVQLLGLMALAGLSLACIPAWGVNGACLALLVAESVQAAAYLNVIRVFLDSKAIQKHPERAVKIEGSP